LPLGNHSHFVFVRFALIVDCNKHGNLWVSIGFFGSNEESYLRTRREQGPWLSMAKTQVAKIEST